MATTAIALWGDRHVPPSAIAQQAAALQAGGVDGMLLADQFGNFIPPRLWKPENAPVAAMLPDPDSHSDVFALSGYLLAAAPGLDITVSSDSVRRGPAELTQAMLTLANMSEGQATIHVGGGEAKQCTPFGYKRSQGMSRMEDLFQIFNALLDSGGSPIDYEGRRWTFNQASIGGAVPKRPKILGLGGGPMLIDHCASYANGIATTCPPVWAGPEEFAAARAEILKTVADKGRDPDEFEFHVWFPCLIAADRAQLESVFGNELIKWLAAVFGRIETPDWERIGLESPFPEGWRYYNDLLPHQMPDAFVDEVLAKVTDDHVTAGWVCGTPAEVASTIQGYIDAGADWVCPLDYLPMVLDPADAEAAFGRSIEVVQGLS
ncbi:MAG: phthiodiolone/phenolphthiodiolone dimycocerosates ketoreductase [Thermoleophilaceae bacterium]|jgi:phthiodiolone/phenolphthiodiolone dimycocerosates ketoreductase|nr:phthiodiolone/phenolphthiodiolone dimycocerosates ketoreductase [Thermoleophilaceae bacterium]